MEHSLDFATQAGEVSFEDLPTGVQAIMKEKMSMIEGNFVLNTMGTDASLRKDGKIFQLMIDMDKSDKSKQAFLKVARGLAHKLQADHYVFVCEARCHTMNMESAGMQSVDIIQISIEDKDYLHIGLNVVDANGDLTEWKFMKHKPHAHEAMSGIVCQSEVDDKGFFNTIRVSSKSMEELRNHLASGKTEFEKTIYMPHSEGAVQMVKYSSDNLNVALGKVKAEMKKGTDFLKDNDEGACLYLGFDEVEHQIFEIRQFVKNKNTQAFVEHMKKKEGVLLYRYKKGKWQFVKNNASIETKIEVEKLLPYVQ